MKICGNTLLNRDYLVNNEREGKGSGSKIKERSSTGNCSTATIALKDSQLRSSLEM
jgi:hypothetical protein